MMKKYLIPGLVLIAIICVIIISKFNNEDSYYRFVADTVVNFYRTDKYKESKIKKDDRKVLSEFLSHLTHKNEEILLDDYIIKNDNYYINSPNTTGVYKKDGKCYIKYEDIGFDKYQGVNYEIEPFREIICDNYRTYLYLSYFYPKYTDTIKNPKYDYSYYNMSKNLSTYSYLYQSTYDGTFLKVMITVNNKKIYSIKTQEVYNEV